MTYKEVDRNSVKDFEGNEKEALIQLIDRYNELVRDYNKNITTKKLNNGCSLCFDDLQNIKDYQIRYTTILQSVDGSTNFYEEAKILNLADNADQWVNPELVKLFFRTAKSYGIGEIKRHLTSEDKHE